MEYIVTICILIYIAINIKIDKNINMDYLSINKTNTIRGLCAILVLGNHIFPLYKNVGYIAVSIFFFLSGYGLMWGLKNKKNYLNGFLKRRLIKILLPYIGINILYIFFYIFVMQEKLSVSEILLSFITVSLNKVAWYIIVIICCYIIFYIIFKNLNRKKGLILYTAIVVMYMGISYIVGLGIWWYISIPTLIIGLYWGEYEKTINKFISKYNKFAILILLGIFIIMFGMLYIFSIEQGAAKAVLTLISEISGTILIFMILTRIKIKNNNGILKKIGDISLEFYLIHPMIIRIVNKFINNESIAIIMIFIFTYIIAKVINIWNQKVNKYLIRRNI